MYDTVEEIQQKLLKTVVFYNNQPIYLASVDNDLNLTCKKIPLKGDSQQLTVHINDPALDFRNLGSRLGYINYTQNLVRESLFSMRVPVRKCQSNQGLSIYNVKIDPFNGDKELGIARMPVGFSDIIRERYAYDTLTNIFPSLNEVRDRFSKEDRLLKSLAFNKNFAIKKQNVGPFYLTYKGKDIGWTEDFSKFKIGPSFKFLEETLIDMEGLKIA